MKNIAKNITTCFLIAIISISSMGFSVNTLYCYCTGQYEASLGNIEHDCTQAQEDADLSNPHPCCKKVRLAACSESAKKHSEKDCTKRNKKYVKADLKFLELTKTELSKSAFIALKLPKITLPFYSIAEIRNPKSKLPTRPPPQYFGRFLLNFIQVYRC